MHGMRKNMYKNSMAQTGHHSKCLFCKSDSVTLLRKRNSAMKSLSGQHLLWNVILLVFRQFPQLQT